MFICHLLNGLVQLELEYQAKNNRIDASQLSHFVHWVENLLVPLWFISVIGMAPARPFLVPSDAGTRKVGRPVGRRSLCKPGVSREAGMTGVEETGHPAHVAGAPSPPARPTQDPPVETY